MKFNIAEARYWWWLRPKDRLLRWFVWHLPRSVVYWCVIRMWATATDNAANLPILTVLNRWKGKPDD